MKIRYYLRGLGLGILFATVFFLVGGNSKQTMSDEMIKERAKELGMIENTVLADLGDTVEESVEQSEEEHVGGGVIILETEEPTETETEETTEETTEEVVLVARPKSEGGAEEVSSVVETSVVEETTEEESTVEETTVVESSEEETEPEEVEEKNTTDEIYNIVVNKGEGSDTVSRKLYEAGLVEDAYEYDQYLIKNGYDRKISAGEHFIPAGASWQEMAQLLCK